MLAWWHVSVHASWVLNVHFSTSNYYQSNCYYFLALTHSSALVESWLGCFPLTGFQQHMDGAVPSSTKGYGEWPSSVIALRCCSIVGVIAAIADNVFKFNTTCKWKWSCGSLSHFVMLGCKLCQVSACTTNISIFLYIADDVNPAKGALWCEIWWYIRLNPYNSPSCTLILIIWSFIIVHKSKSPVQLTNHWPPKKLVVIADIRAEFNTRPKKLRNHHH